MFGSGHFANWEVMAAASQRVGIDGVLAYRGANNPYIDARMRESRRRYGITLFAPKGAKGGREIWIEASYNPVRDRNGKPAKVVKFATNITPKKIHAMEAAGKVSAVAPSDWMSRQLNGAAPGRGRKSPL